MLDITIVSIGKIKESFYLEAYNEYIKRLQPYARVKAVELAPEPFLNGTKEKSKEAEGKRVVDFLSKYNKDKTISSVYLLAERGQTFDSPALAVWLEKKTPMILIVGGALGFSDELYSLYPQISLSPLTFPHELARVVLAEQLYRAAAILNKKEYHY